IACAICPKRAEPTQALDLPRLKARKHLVTSRLPNRRCGPGHLYPLLNSISGMRRRTRTSKPSCVRSPAIGRLLRCGSKVRIRFPRLSVAGMQRAANGAAGVLCSTTRLPTLGPNHLIALVDGRGTRLHERVLRSRTSRTESAEYPFS